MNLVYRSIWNETTGTCVAASEDAKSAGKKTSLYKRAKRTAKHVCLEIMAISLISPFAPNAYALPEGGVVAAGSAGIGGGPGSTTITQSSQNVVINWQSFSIGQRETVRFVQPNSSSVALNRVLGPDPSSILGSLSANGKVFMVNPNGILFGRGAQVNVGGLVASTLNISDSDFMVGKYQFSGSSTASVLNQGAINADGGYVALLGANVGNDGIIVARFGTVVLAAGNAITLDVAGDGLLNVAVNQGAVSALAQNGGLIQAGGGQVLLTAKAAGSLLQSAVNNTGIIEAQTIENHNGIIRLLGDRQSGTVSVGGTLNVSGAGAGQTGGRIEVTGHHVGLLGARIDASADAGGGTVLIGGDYQGKNPTVENAAATYMSADSTITADAIMNGNGGTVVVWSDESTRAYGSITARGGALGGNGGLIETSGHWLDVAGIRIDASAQNGKAGTWLLDPADITISGAATAGIPVGPIAIYAPDTGVNTSTLNTANLRTALEAGNGTNVTITTTNTGVQGAPPSGRGDITIASALTWTPVATATLTLNAAGDVNINAAVSATRGSLEVCCGRDINVNAAITIKGAVGIPNTGGNVLLSAGRDVNIVRAANTIPLPNLQLTDITVTSGNIEICAGNNINLGNTFDGGALITLTNSVAASLPPTGPVTPRGMTLIAGAAATGPGVAGGGTLKIGGGTIITVTGPAGISPINITYNPTSYTAPTNYSGFFTGTGGPVNQLMLVFPGGAGKVYDGTNAATFTSFKPDINGLVPGGGGLTLAGGIANYDTTAAGVNKPITYSGFTLGGASAGFALPTGCCGAVTTTTGTITAAPLSVTANDQSKSYGTAFTFAGTEFSTTGLQNTDAIDSVTLTSLGTPASAHVAGGPYSITPSAAIGVSFSASNYNITYTPAPVGFTVSPANLTITANNQSKTYGTAFAFAGTEFSSNALKNTDAINSVTLTSLGGPATAHVAGSPYPITPSLAVGAAFAATDYNITYTPAPVGFTVSPANLTITANNQSKTYGTAFAFAGTEFSSSALKNADAIDSVMLISPGAAAAAHVVGSPYAITPSAAIGAIFAASDYNITYTPAPVGFTVSPANLTITANNQSKTYGTAFAFAGTEFSSSALKNTDAIDSVTLTSFGAPATAHVVGSPYAITPSLAVGAAFSATDYNITYTPAPLGFTVSAAPLTVTAPVVAPPVAPLIVVPPVTPLFGVPLPEVMPQIFVVVLVEAPDQLLSVIPELVLAAVPADIPEIAQNQVPIIVPAQAPAKNYVAPIRPRKQDRN
jgi:filamentous hemagglutinin family protein